MEKSLSALADDYSKGRQESPDKNAEFIDPLEDIDEENDELEERPDGREKQKLNKKILSPKSQKSP